MKPGQRVTIKSPFSDYHNLTGVIVEEFQSCQADNYHYYVAFDQTELRKSKRPEIVLKAKSKVYFLVKELELANVST